MTVETYEEIVAARLAKIDRDHAHQEEFRMTVSDKGVKIVPSVIARYGKTVGAVEVTVLPQDRAVVFVISEAEWPHVVMWRQEEA